MTNSDTRKSSYAILDEVFVLIDEEYLHHTIDEPIEKAAASFEFDNKAPITHKYFLRTISDFVRHVYAHSFFGRQKLSSEQASNEALYLIEEGYQNPHAKGFYAAYLDALNPNQKGLESVLAKMIEFINEMLRERHIRFVFTSRIDSLDWHTKCLIADILLKLSEPYLTSNILGCSSAQIANYLPDLINTLLSTDRMISKILAPNID